MIKIKLVFLTLLYLPHLLLFSSSKRKNVIIADVKVFVANENPRVGGGILSVVFAISDPYFRKLFYYRLGKKSKFVSWYSPGEENLKFSSRLILGEGCYVAHAYSTYINAKNVGKNLAIRNCTTIGNKSDNDVDALPVIGDNVSIGANVCIIGDIVIGNNVVIGAGSVVVKDIPDNSIVVGNPGRVIKTIS